MGVHPEAACGLGVVGKSDSLGVEYWPEGTMPEPPCPMGVEANIGSSLLGQFVPLILQERVEIVLAVGQFLDL